MRTLTFLAAGGSITAFVCWCVVRAGGRPTPQPDKQPNVTVSIDGRHVTNAKPNTRGQQ